MSKTKNILLDKCGQIELEIGRRLQAIRDYFGLSQTEFARRIGLTLSKIANYENGRTVISCAVALKICRHFIISEEWLATGQGSMRFCLDLMASPEYLNVNPDEPFSKTFNEVFYTRVALLTQLKDTRLTIFDQIERLLETSKSDPYQLWNLLNYVLYINNPDPEFPDDPAFIVDKKLPVLYIDLIRRCYKHMLDHVGKKWLKQHHSKRNQAEIKEMKRFDKVLT